MICANTGDATNEIQFPHFDPGAAAAGEHRDAWQLNAEKEKKRAGMRPGRCKLLRCSHCSSIQSSPQLHYASLFVFLLDNSDAYSQAKQADY